MPRVELALLAVVLMGAAASAQPGHKMLVAHRGASAYAPEHTLASYRLALAQGADFVEQDLAVTKDAQLICLHDPTLERTTNVEDVFPSRFTEIMSGGASKRVWLANDFTLAEIKQLDAGSWFDPRFAGERVATFDEAVALVRGKAGLFPELKTPEVYEGRNVHFEELVIAALDAHHLRGPSADPRTPVILQTFGEASARTLAQLGVGVPVVLLLDRPDRLDTAAKVQAWKGIVQGLGPAKAIVRAHPDLVGWAHAAGMMVIPYTFRAADHPGFPSATAEMEQYLYTLGVDGLFTDNPDQFPRR